MEELDGAVVGSEDVGKSSGEGRLYVLILCVWAGDERGHAEGGNDGEMKRITKKDRKESGKREVK